MASAATILQEIKRAVEDKKTERAQRNAAQLILARYGSGKLPEIKGTRAADGATVRIYAWKGTPAGDFAIVTGPSLIPDVHDLSDLSPEQAHAGVYVEGAAVPAALEQRVDAQLKRTMAKAVKHAVGASAPPVRHTAPAAGAKTPEAMRARLMALKGQLAKRMNPPRPPKGTPLDELNALRDEYRHRMDYRGHGFTKQWTANEAKKAKIKARILELAQQLGVDPWREGPRTNGFRRRNPLEPGVLRDALRVLEVLDPELAIWVREHPELAEDVLGEAFTIALQIAKESAEDERGALMAARGESLGHALEGDYLLGSDAEDEYVPAPRTGAPGFRSERLGPDLEYLPGYEPGEVVEVIEPEYSREAEREIEIEAALQPGKDAAYQEALEGLVEIQQARYPGYTIEVEPSLKYTKIWKSRGGSRSIVYFVDQHTGDVFVSSSSKAPTKPAIGTIYNLSKFGTGSITADGDLKERKARAPKASAGPEQMHVHVTDHKGEYPLAPIIYRNGVWALADVREIFPHAKGFDVYHVPSGMKAGNSFKVSHKTIGKTHIDRMARYLGADWQADLKVGDQPAAIQGRDSNIWSALNELAQLDKSKAEAKGRKNDFGPNERDYQEAQEKLDKAVAAPFVGHGPVEMSFEDRQRDKEMDELERDVEYFLVSPSGPEDVEKGRKALDRMRALDPEARDPRTDHAEKVMRDAVRRGTPKGAPPPEPPVSSSQSQWTQDAIADLGRAAARNHGLELPDALLEVLPDSFQDGDIEDTKANREAWAAGYQDMFDKVTLVDPADADTRGWLISPTAVREAWEVSGMGGRGPYAYAQVTDAEPRQLRNFFEDLVTNMNEESGGSIGRPTLWIGDAVKWLQSAETALPPATRQRIAEAAAHAIETTEKAQRKTLQDSVKGVTDAIWMFLREIRDGVERGGSHNLRTACEVFGKLTRGGDDAESVIGTMLGDAEMLNVNLSADDAERLAEMDEDDPNRAWLATEIRTVHGRQISGEIHYLRDLLGDACRDEPWFAPSRVAPRKATPVSQLPPPLPESSYVSVLRPEEKAMAKELGAKYFEDRAHWGQVERERERERAQPPAPVQVSDAERMAQFKELLKAALKGD